VIKTINKAVSGINSLRLKIPDWVPSLGGKEFKISIPKIPLLAMGGFTNGPSIAGEAGREAVISFQPAARDRNIEIWTEAGRMLGLTPTSIGLGFPSGNSLGAVAEMWRGTITSLQSLALESNIGAWAGPGRIPEIESPSVELPEFPSGGSVSVQEQFAPQLAYSPSIVIQGSADKEVIERALKESEERLDKWWGKKIRSQRRVAWG